MESKLSAILLLMASFPAIAYVSHDAAPGKLIYCPQQIECTEEGNKNSCKAVGGDQQYWNTPVSGYESGRIVRGIYTLSYVSSPYQLPRKASSSCSYKNSDSGFNKTISFNSKDNVNLEASYGAPESQWQVLGYDAECHSTNNLQCPLAEIK